MAKIAINSVTNCNVYAEGANLLGRALEVTLPTPTIKMVDHKGLGMAAEVEIPAGGLEKMEADFKWASVYPEVIRATAHPKRTVQLQVRATVESYTGQGLTGEMGLVVHLSGIFKNIPTGFAFKHQEAVQPESKMTVYYERVVVSGEVLLEVDVLNNIYRAGGVDVLANFLRLIGG